MRTTLLGSLLDVARGNLARGAERVAIFESGRVYLSGEEPGDGPLAGRFPGKRPPPALESHRLGGLAVGAPAASGWRDESRAADFFAAKAVLEALAGQLGADLVFEAASEPFLHPGRAARLTAQGRPAGWIGEVHPLVCRGWDIEAAVAFEVSLGALIDASSAGEEDFEDVTTFPAVHQDLAVVVPEGVTADMVRGAVLSGGGELLRAAAVFDLYRGEQLGEGRKSLALRLEFRAADRTLTDQEVAGLRDEIEAKLAEVGGSLREQ
jgi:phenylalanyl-tRNA synthetase beta chain